MCIKILHCVIVKEKNPYTIFFIYRKNTMLSRNMHTYFYKKNIRVRRQKKQNSVFIFFYFISNLPCNADCYNMDH